MSIMLKAAAVAAAMVLAVLAWQVLPGKAIDNSPAALAKPAEPPAQAIAEISEPTPPASPREERPPAARRSADIPLQHAILRDEQDDDSPEILIARQLDKPTTVAFLDLPLEDCLAFLKEFHNVNIWIDKATLADEGVALDQPITLQLAGVSFESILHLILDPLQLDWLIQDEVLKITTRAWANRHPETRTYDVHNLIAAGHKSEDLISSITKCIEPASWTSKDAIAGISHTGGVLVVRQSQRVHGEIAQLLEDLDTIAVKNDEAEAGKEAKTAALTIGHIH